MSDAPIAVGTPAPDFTLPSTAGEQVSLSALRGKRVLLAFFPAAFTGTCTAEMCEFTSDFAEYTSRNAVVLPISVDQVPSLKVFAEQEKVTVPLLSDSRREVSRAYGVLDEEKFWSRRAYVLIDENGVVRWSYVEPQASHKRDTSELIRQLDALG
jgi:peroxiredoxin